MQLDTVTDLPMDTTVIEFTGYGVYGYARGLTALAIIAVIVALIVWRRRRRTHRLRR